MAAQADRDLEARIRELYFDPAAARRVMGMSKDRFDYLVKTGVIEKTTFFGGAKGYFLKSHIHALANQIDALLIAAQQSALTFRVATVNDMDAEDNLALLNFGARALNPETRAARRAFIQTNPSSSFHVYDRTLLAASLNLVPLEHWCIEEFREGKRGWLFPPSAIKQFVPGEPLECIIIDFMSLPSVPQEKRTSYAIYLLTELGKLLTTWGGQGIAIASVHACGASSIGRRLLQSAGFTFLKDTGGGRHIYYLDLETSDLRLLRGYKEALEEYKRKGG